MPFYNTQSKAFCFLASWFCLALFFLIIALFSENKLEYSLPWSVSWYVHSWMFPFFTCCLYAIRLASASGKPLCWSFHTCLENIFLAIIVDYGFLNILFYYFHIASMLHNLYCHHHTSFYTYWLLGCLLGWLWHFKFRPLTLGFTLCLNLCRKTPECKCLDLFIEITHINSLSC